MAELSIIPDLIRELDRLQAVAQAAQRTVTRLRHPTIDQDDVPAEVITATLFDLEQALAELVDEEELDESWDNSAPEFVFNHDSR